MYDLEKIKQNIIESGSITKEDVVELRKIVYLDGRVSRREANFLFDLRKDLFDFGNLAEWDEFFIQAICDHVLDDRTSPEAVDNREAEWLIEKIGEDEVIDKVEQELLRRLRAKAKHFPTNLKQIQKHTSIAKDLGRKILQMLCHNTHTARALQYGVNITGQRKKIIIFNQQLKDEDH